LLDFVGVDARVTAAKKGVTTAGWAALGGDLSELAQEGSELLGYVATIDLRSVPEDISAEPAAQ
jgi:hypothetical protein